MAFTYDAVFVLNLLKGQEKLHQVLEELCYFMNEFNKENELRRIIFGLSAI